MLSRHKTSFKMSSSDNFGVLFKYVLSRRFNYSAIFYDIQRTTHAHMHFMYTTNDDVKQRMCQMCMGEPSNAPIAIGIDRTIACTRPVQIKTKRDKHVYKMVFTIVATLVRRSNRHNDS